MTVIAFIGIMTGVVFVSMSGKRTETALKVAAREVAAAIRTAQSNALAGVRDPVNGNGLCFHRVKYFDSGTYKIWINHLRSGNSRVCTNSGDIDEKEWSTFSLKNGVTFQADWNGASNGIVFGVPRANVDNLGGAARAIVLTKGSTRLAVCVLASGTVIEQPIGTTTCP